MNIENILKGFEMRKDKKDLYNYHIGKWVEITLHGTMRYGVYRGMTLEGELILIPSLASGVSHGKTCLVMDKDRPYQVSLGSVQAVGPVTEGYALTRIKESRDDDDSSVKK